MTDPRRAARVWLAVAVATLWAVSVGSHQEDVPEASLFPTQAFSKPAGRRRCGTRRRLVSLLRWGVNAILTAVIQHSPLPLGSLIPDSWPRDSLQILAPVT
jgi:hypothetical protein